MADISAFWSYVRKDDAAEKGRIKQLAEDIAQEYGLQVGEDLNLFFDTQTLTPGVDWADEISKSIDMAPLFIPILTPRFFKSDSCRDEVTQFTQRVEKLGQTELIMSIYYVDTPAFNSEEPGDLIMAQLKRYHWTNWRDLRMLDREDAKYREAVSTFASAIATAINHAEQESTAQGPPVDSDAEVPTEDDDSPGLLDSLGEMEDTFPKYQESLEAATASITDIGEIMQRGAAEMTNANSSPKALATRLLVARRTAAELTPVVESLESSADSSGKHLLKLDTGMQAIFSMMDLNLDTEDEGQIQDFAETVHELARSGSTSMSGLQEMVDSSVAIEAMSKDLRPPLRKMKAAIRSLQSATKILDSWSNEFVKRGYPTTGTEQA